MENILLPTYYSLEVYEEDFDNLIETFESNTPFQNINKGDIFEHRNLKLYNTIDFNIEELRVSEIKHIIWKIEQDHITHKIMIIVKKSRKTT